MTKFNIKLKKYRTKGKLSWEYNPFHNMSKVQNNVSESSINLEDFDTNKLTFDVSHPVDIECQPAYDGSVNLILNDDLNVPRIVNSGFTVKENNTYERVKRNQEKQTNIYNEEYIDSETRLQRTTNEESQFLKISLEDVEPNGELAGGNYVFFVRYTDDDENETRIICESGIIPIYNGGVGKFNKIDPKGVYGTLMNEKTNKSIKLTFSNIDKSFSKIKLGYKRNYCDLNGVVRDEYKLFSKLYKIPSGEKSFTITIDGREEVIDISFGEIVKQYNTYHKVKTQTQVQDILFFGNVEEKVENISLLQSLSYYVQIKANYDETGIGKVDVNQFKSDSSAEYYNPKNIYNKLGYFPEEYYRLGIVYVYNDDSISGVYNLRGCVFKELNKWNTEEIYIPELSPNHNELFINNSTDNTKGVFKMPDVTILGNDESSNIKPLILQAKIPEYILKELENENIKGYYFVRQPRIPIFIAQAYSIGVSENSYTPLLSKTDDNGSVNFFTQTPVLEDYTLGVNNQYCNKSDNIKVKGLVCADVMLKSQLQSLLDGSEFKLKAIKKYYYQGTQDDNRYIARIGEKTTDENTYISEKLIYIPENTSVKTYNSLTFSTKAGSSEDVRSLRNLKWNSSKPGKIDKYSVRGNFMPFIGVCLEGDKELESNTIYNIYTSSYGLTESEYKIQIQTRSTDKSAYTAITDRFSIKTIENSSIVYQDNIIDICRGDCFININSLKVQSNFLDYQTPLNDKIVNPHQLKDIENYDEKIYSEWSVKDWTKLNVSDWNSIDLAALFIYKSLSNYNLCARAIDSQNLDEISLFGDVRKFYPHDNKVGGGISWKIPESTLVNSGNSVTNTIIPNFEVEQVPYIKNTFDNRIVFSNYSVNNSFSNGYRVFSGLSYQDIDRQYGAIVKLLPFGADLFCVFEHGCGIIPVNQKALIQTTQGQSIHMYGAGVLQSQVTVISQDYGSIWEDSIISTPNGIYGVDTFAKKIWKFDGKAFSLISDQLIQRFLNENIILNDSDMFPTIAIKNVKTHYNNFKGDVMFTFYKDDKVWNLCYNERIGKFVTRYSWTPLLSSNIQNSFISIDKDPVEIYSLIGKNNIVEDGLKIESGFDNLYKFELKELNTYRNDENSAKELVYWHYRQYELIGFNGMYDAVKASIRSIEYPEYDELNNKVVIKKIENNESNCCWIEFNDDNDRLDTFVIGWDEKQNFETQSSEDTLYDHVLDFKAKFKNYVSVEYGHNLTLEMKLSKFIPWIKINLNATPILENFKEENEWIVSNKILGQPFKQTLCLMADYDHLNSINTEEYQNYINTYNNICRINLYTHGQAGNYSEINYSDENPDNQIKPTFWYNKQEPFEFEFVVNEPSGIQKIFDNLVIISNNAEPESLEFSLIGDAYDFNKAGIFASDHTIPTYDSKTGILNEEKLKNDKLEREYSKSNISQLFKNLFSNNSVSYSTEIEKDNVTNQYYLKVSDDCRNVKNVGRRLGNIEYREDKWLVNITPIYYKNKFRNNNSESMSSINSTKLRDKWIKIRIKYKGDKLVVISAIQTLMTLSYS